MTIAVGVRAGWALSVALFATSVGDYAFADISTGGEKDISTGGVSDISTGGGLDISTGGLYDISTGGAYVLSGIVTSIEVENGVFISLGQTVYASVEDLKEMSVGDHISVFGSVIGAGAIYADAVELNSAEYVAGSTATYLIGIPTSVDVSTGILTIGELKVDITRVSNIDSMSQVGANGYVSIEGIQPVIDGVVLAESL